MSEELIHYGMPRRSGRYPWGSGKNPYQRAKSWRAHIDELKRQGLSEAEIAKYEGITTTELRARMSITKKDLRTAERAEALRLKEKGYSNTEIGRIMGKNESSIRNLLDPVLAERATIAETTSNILKEEVDKKRFIDIGAGVANHLGVRDTTLNNAIAILKEQGYKVHTVNVNQVGNPGQFTIMKVLGAPDTTWKELKDDISQIKGIDAYSKDYGRTFERSILGLEPVKYISSDRVMVRFAEDGGKDKDGVIELRRGVPELDLGQSKYAQVRIGVDGTHFLKGMAIYSDDMPDGVDIIFNTNKSKSVGKLGAMKKLKTLPDGSIDEDNPFGSYIKRQSGALNIVNEEGDWYNWSKTLSSQVLSKQPVSLAKQQLDLAYKERYEEFEEIMSLTNPVLKRHLLAGNGGFADECDAAAVHLKAAALPRQASKVILPVPGLKEDEVYAPTFKDGEIVVLIRHPHGGRFEIPQLKVNNRSKEAKAIMENAIDAVGINPKVAQKLSGADFDGDTVIVIPNNKGFIKVADTLKKLKDFDPIEAYKIPEGSNIKPIKPHTKQTKMGEISNLITDMTIKGASLDEIAMAVRHSMVVIDAEKHNLDYRQSYIDHGIASLSKEYQGKERGGASTLISRASSEIRVPDRKPRSAAEGGPIDPATGKKVYTPTGEYYTDSKGRKVLRTIESTKMAETDDAFTLSSGTPMEEVYANYANSLKALANRARKEALATKPTAYNPSARKAYAKEVASLNAQLNNALKNKPLERQAQILANSIVKRKKQDNPYMDKDELKKIRTQALAEARVRTGAKKNLIKISEREWEAIQAGAISTSKLKTILDNADLDQVKQLATPKNKPALTPARLSRAKSMLKSGYTHAEIADALGVSTSTIINSLKDG